VILVDTNLLLYANVKGGAEHERARAWFDAQFRGGARIGLPWDSLLGFVHIVSNPRAHASFITVEEAWRHVRTWLRADNVWIPQPTERHDAILDEVFTSTRSRTGDVMDAHLAALAIEHGLILCSADRDFARYPALRWFNPLAA
jgi:toxin-antitoxin system PIN domain toxin